MKPYNRSIRDFFGSDVLYEVPRYQRPYVWSRDRHWEPLWEDVQGLADTYLAGSTTRHFLGAIVLQRDEAAPGGVTHWRVIDGQQRLTTLQLLLAASAAAAQEAGADQPGRLFRKLVTNDPDVAEAGETLKLSPTMSDKAAFELVLQEGGPPPDAPDDADNTIQEAFAYFSEVVKAWALGGGTEPDDLRKRYTDLHAVLGDLLQMVSINLESEDDAQIIFETLNARGTPLLQIELVKNAVLDRARKQGADADALHDEQWAPELGQSYWRKERRQGRLIRPRSEIFLSHWLEMKLAQEVGSRELFALFRTRLLDADGGPHAVDLVTELRQHAATMREMEHAAPETAAGRFFRVMRALDTSTFHPLALRLFTAKGLDPDRRDRALAAIESFVVRRMLRGLTTKAYNRITVDILKAGVGEDAALDDVVIGELVASSADSARWPTDDGLAEHLGSQSLYNWIGQAKIRLVLGEIELRRRQHAKVEDIYELPKLSIEHLMPVEWKSHWPLAEASPEDIEQRERALHVLGNLTLVTGQLNSSMSNQSWPEKRKRLGEKSLLLLNREFADVEIWDEDAIRARGVALSAELCARWPGPAAFKADYVPPPLGPPPGERHAKWAEMSSDEVLQSFTGGSELFRELLLDLAAHPDEPRPFLEVEDAIGWSRGRLASVLGGYANRAAKEFDGRRPYRISTDEDERWWIWLEEERAKSILAAASLSEAP